MKISIKNLDEIELLNEDFTMVNINDKLYEFIFSKNGIVDIVLEKDKLYKVYFENAEHLGLTGVILMIYNSYYFNASTGYKINELGEQVSTVLINANAITMKKY